MDVACTEIAAQAHGRLRAIQRSRCFFSTPLLMHLHKSHILSYIEYSTPAVYQTPAFFLSQIDRVQETFLDELGVSVVTAFMEFNLAPLTTRRDIAMMGLLYRITHGLAPPQFSQVIRLASREPFPRCLRPGSRNNLQLHDPIDGTRTGMMGRSVLGMVYSFNMLPQAVVDAKTVSASQRCLQQGVRHAARTGALRWEGVLRNGVKSMPIKTYHELFL